MEGNSFKSSLFGGFNREDVIRYIEKTAAEANERIAALEKERDALDQELTGLRQTLQTESETTERLSAALAEARDGREAAETALTQAVAELEQLRAEFAAAQEETSTLSSQVAHLRPQAEEYSSVKNRIAGVELLAQQRADALEAATRKRLFALIGACKTQCEQALLTLGDTCSNVSTELRRADAMVSQLPAAFQTLRSSLEELEVE